MGKKEDNNSQKDENQKEKKLESDSEQDDNHLLKTPQKKRQQPSLDNPFNHLEPLPLPPKINQPVTASSNGNPPYGQDMKVIQTPLTHRHPNFTSNRDQNLQDYLRPITGKIFWPNTPAKSQQYDSEDQQQSSQPQSDQNTPQSSYSKDQPIEKQQSSYPNPEIQPTTERLKPPIYQPQRQKPTITKRNVSARKFIDIASFSQTNISNGGKKVFCNCKKTKCLKLYCDCFRINQKCEGCNCSGCHNLDQYSEERNNAILALMERNPDPFSQKIDEDQHLKGCNCKKSFCLKKYCECFQAGLKCGQNCKCDVCKNGGGSQKRQKDRMERQGFEIRENQCINI